MDRVEIQPIDPVATVDRPNWRTPELRIESVAALTGIDPGSPGDDGSIYPNHGFYS
jgi:hypothetical protein